MNKFHTEKLFRDFPSFFSDRGNPKVSLMGFGFECGDGWFPLIYKLCQDIEAVLREMCRNLYPDLPVKLYPNLPGLGFQVEQVKEKFGGLRFYIGAAIPKIHDLIAVAETESFHICEDCGEAGELRNQKGWLATLCLQCYEKRSAKQ